MNNTPPIAAQMPPLPDVSFLGDDISYGYDREDMHAYAQAYAAQQVAEGLASTSTQATSAVEPQKHTVDELAIAYKDGYIKGGIDAALELQRLQNARPSAVELKTQPVQTWESLVQLAHPKSDPVFWPDELRVKYMAAEIAAHRAATPPPVAGDAERMAILKAIADAGLILIKTHLGFELVKKSLVLASKRKVRNDQPQ